MMNDYQILGIAENADPKEIKRAYFRLVRQYSPETDPERFQEIREAYEHLTAPKQESAEREENTLSYPVLPYSDELRKRILSLLHMGDYSQAAEIAEKTVDFLGESEGFLYLLGSAQIAAGNTGKAIKTFERLVELFPKRLLFHQELAFSLMKRGFGKKAYQVFTDAYAIGCRDLEFLNLFSICCKNRKKYSQAVNLLYELIDLAEKKPKDTMEELLNAFTGIFVVKSLSGKKNIAEDLKRFSRFLDISVPYLPDYDEELFYLLKSIIQMELKSPEEQNLLDEVISKAKKALSTGMPSGDDFFQEEWKMLDAEREHRNILKDDRFPDVLKSGLETFLIGYDKDELDEFAKLDIELCILEEWSSIQDKIEIIRREYPLYYHAIHEFFDRCAQTDDIDRLRKRLSKDYDRKAKYISGGYYYELYPHRAPSAATSLWDSENEGTYTRSTPKISRNSPCPCGSGKKYKNCCGKK